MLPVRFSQRFDSFPELLRDRVGNHGGKTAIVFLSDGESVSDLVTYRALDTRAREVAHWVSGNVPSGGRVILSFNPGVDFIYAFLGCLYAGRTAVPSYPPRKRGNLSRLESIASNANASVVLSSRSVMDDLSPHPSGSYFHQCPWHSIESIQRNSSAFTEPEIDPNQLALLQYTSGSTGIPKGVCVTHSNLLHNQEVIHSTFEQLEEEMVMGGWLPMYHDMGLIGSMLHALSMGGKLVFMPPLAFLQKPIRWLRMNSLYRVTLSGGPNFAYDLCVDRTTPEERHGLDLSAWSVAFNGAEPLRFETLRRFGQTFAPYGLPKNAISPCYGMAEATLMVTGSTPREPWRSVTVDATALRNNEIITIENQESETNAAESAEPNDASSVHRLVSSGKIHSGFDLAIVAPDTCTRVKTGEVGEIWLNGESVAQGYWNRPELSSEQFHAKLIDDGSNLGDSLGPYLRTGDLGFIRDGELYITGRLKDLIILNGENHYPQDLEGTAERSHSDLTVGACVAFGFDKSTSGIGVDSRSQTAEHGYAEQVFIAVEVSRAAMRSFDLNAIVATVYQAIWDEHQVAIDGLLLVRPGGIPKTTSGKLQRRLTRQMFQENTLLVLANWQRNRDGAPIPNAVASGQKNARVDQAISYSNDAISVEQQASITELGEWLQKRVASVSGVTLELIDRTQPIALYGLKSIAMVQLAGELATKVNQTLTPTLIYDYPSIQAICRYLIRGADHALPFQPTSATECTDEPIAIVGIACRMPGATTLDEFKDLLYSNRCTIGPFPVRRREDQSNHIVENASRDWNAGHFRGGFLESIDQFDPLFFGISPREAEETDPQQRLMLEVALEAFENAGILPQPKTRVETGVFIGVSGNEFARSMMNAGCTVNGYTATGNSMALVANRISYLFNFRGPSLTVDTACSSSLVAVHLAAQSILRGECELALAGGVSLQASSDVTQSLSAAGMLSPTGISRAFAAGADGFVRGEGCGAVLLKRLSHAQRDGDPIICLLSSSAINQDGRSNGLTAPNGLAQQEVIRTALRRAKLEPTDIEYIEAHGTSTELGDPIEMGSISAVFAPRTIPLCIGSVKSNIGHLEGAAGIAGMIKACIALQEQSVPAHLHFDEPSPHIDWQPGIIVPSANSEWKRRNNRVRRAGVSSFGFGGTNAHIILEEAPPTKSIVSTSDISSNRWLKISAKTPEAFVSLALRYAGAFSSSCGNSEDERSNLDAIAYSANVGRSDYLLRGLVQFNSREQLVSRLRDLSNLNLPTTSSIQRSFGARASNQPKFDDSLDHWTVALQCYLTGGEVHWKQLYETDHAGHGVHIPARSRVKLPNYPFQRQRCWFKPGIHASPAVLQSLPSLPALETTGQSLTLKSDLIGTQLDLGGEVIIFETDLRNFPELADHRVRGESIFPAAGYLELAMAAGLHASNITLCVEDLRLDIPLQWNSLISTRVQLFLHPSVDSKSTADLNGKAYYHGEVMSRQPNGWRKHASFQLVHRSASIDGKESMPPIDANSTPWSIADHYRQCSSVGLEYSQNFQSLKSISTANKRVHGMVELNHSPETTPPPSKTYVIHPALLDGCFQSIATLLSDEDSLWLPVSVEQYRLSDEAVTTDSFKGPLQFVASMRDLSTNQETNAQRVFDFAIYNGSERLVAIVSGLVIQRVAKTPFAQTEESQEPLHGDESEAVWVQYEKWVSRIRPVERTRSPKVTAKELGTEVRRIEASLVAQSGYAIDLPYRSKLDQLSGGWAANALVDLYGELEVGFRIAREGLLDLVAIAPEKRLLFFRVLEILCETGSLESVADGWLVKRRLVSVGMVQLSHDCLRNHPRMAPEIQLLLRCGPFLSDVLRGDVDPLPLLFSDKLAGSAVDVYTRAAGAQVLNNLLVEAAVKQAERLPEGRALRVLEIGGGTGATTRSLLEKLPRNRISYTFTDIARSFLNAAKEDFSAFESDPTLAPSPSNTNGISFLAEHLNIEQDPGQQGFEFESYDLIVAANVLHATASLDETLDHVSSLLAPGGQLLLLEGTRPVSWMDLTFGLTEGWWRFAERDNKRQYPLVSPSIWKNHLEARGFLEFECVDPSQIAPSQGANTSRKAGDVEPAGENVLIIATKLNDTSKVAVSSGLETPQEFFLIGSHSKSCEALEDELTAKGAICHTLILDSVQTSAVREQVEARLKKTHQTHALHVVLVGQDLIDSGDSSSLDSFDREAFKEPHSDIAMLDAIKQSIGVIQAALSVQGAHESSVRTPRFSLVTRGVFNVDWIEGALSSTKKITAFPLVGVMRTMSLEQPSWLCRTIDLDPNSGTSLAFAVDELLTSEKEIDDEHEIAVRNGVRFARRLMESEKHLDLYQKREVLRIGTPGNLESLLFKQVAAPKLGDDEIEIEVHAAGLNFRDCLISLGKYPDAALLGSECTGIVKRLGPRVSSFQIGQRVLAVTPDCFADRVFVRASGVVPLPDDFDFATGASLPVAYLTASIALESLVTLKRGSTVLIHAATGGVGLAAISLCQARGANIFATSSQPKHSYLYGMGLNQVYDSRQVGFADKILQSNGGMGVQVLLNTLDETFAHENLRSLAHGGIYIDITKPSDTLESLIRQTRPDVTYHCFDLSKMLQTDSASLLAECSALMQRVADGELSLLPFSIVSMSQAQRAFRKMQRATHIGKIVLTRDNDAPCIRFAKQRSIRSDRAYAITGGLGDLGLMTAEALLEMNAGLVALIGRNPPTQTQQLEIDRLREIDDRILVLQADVADRHQLDNALSKVRSKLPLGGVIHSAGRLADALLLQQTEDGIEQVWGAKGRAAWNLHTLTKGDSLEQFVLYSSLASTLGAPGQVNHSAANAGLDGLADWRMANNQPFTCINWGPWSETGEAMRRNVSERSDLRGIEMIDANTGKEYLKQILQTSDLKVTIAPLKVANMQTRLQGWSLFEYLRRQKHFQSIHQVELRSQLAALSARERPDWIVEKVTVTLAEVLGIENKLEISSEIAFSDLGLDSLTGIEFVDTIQRQWGIKLPASVVYDYPTISKLTGFMMLQLDSPLTPSQISTEAPIENTMTGTNEVSMDFDTQLSGLLTELRRWE